GYENIVKYLIDNGAYINRNNDDDNSLLHIAYTIENINIVKYLISNDVYIKINNNNGDTPL
ncbi:hypothetical protein BCR36DRAFT_254111, partial [Piromyces finnis]